MNKELRELLLRQGYIYYTEPKGEASDEAAAALLTSLLSLGFTLSADAASFFREHAISKKVYNQIYRDCKKVIGANHNHKVFYRNFPSLDGMGEDEFVLRAILHYFTVYNGLDPYMGEDIAVLERLPHVKPNKLKVLKVADKTLAKKILADYFTGLFEGPRVISTQTLWLYDTFLKTGGRIFPKEINIHENLVAYVTTLGLKEGERPLDHFSKIDLSPLRTVTDILRVYAVLSNPNQTQLTKRTTLISLPRKVRRVLVERLSELDSKNPFAIEDYHLHRELWKKAFEYLHIGEYTSYKSLQENVALIRSGVYTTYMGKVEGFIKAKDTKGLVDTLSIKPGIFARSLNYILTQEGLDQDRILEGFKMVIDKISSSVLYSLYEYLLNRNDLDENRYFHYRYFGLFLTHSILEEREELSPYVLDGLLLVIKDALRERYSNLPSLGKVYISPLMKNITIPSNFQSTGLNCLPTYSKIPLSLENFDTLRFFTHWKNLKDRRVDIDLSLEMYDEDFLPVGSLSWHCARPKEGCTFSGDVTTAPEGASEFVDIDLNTKRERVRYIAVCNAVYSGPNFPEIPECYSGFMARKGPKNEGEIFEADTVQTKFDLAADARMNLSFLFDVERKEIIWIDLPHTGTNHSIAALKDFAATLNKATKPHLSFYDVVMLHQNHLTLVEDRGEADLTIGEDETYDINPYNLMSNLVNWL